MFIAQTGASISEQQLIEQCQTGQAGWQAALAQWLHGSPGWLHRHCTVRLGCATTADDAVQEISLKVMSAIGQFEGRSTLRTWVTRIADNHCNGVIRQQCANLVSDHLQYSMILMEQNRFVSQEDADILLFILISKSSIFYQFDNKYILSSHATDELLAPTTRHCDFMARQAL